MILITIHLCWCSFLFFCVDFLQMAFQNISSGN